MNQIRLRKRNMFSHMWNPGFYKRDEKAEGGPFGERNETGLGGAKEKNEEYTRCIHCSRRESTGVRMCHTDTVGHGLW